MKKTYITPAIKTMRVFNENVMQLAAVSGGNYEQGIGGQGSDADARSIDVGLF